MGVGGIGINAVQGAKFAGASRIIAVDPAPFHRDMALKFGATDVFENMAQATDMSQALHDDQGAASALVTVRVVTADHVAEALADVSKSGTSVLTHMGPDTEHGARQRRVWGKRVCASSEQ